MTPSRGGTTVLPPELQPTASLSTPPAPPPPESFMDSAVPTVQSGMSTPAKLSASGGEHAIAPFFSTAPGFGDTHDDVGHQTTETALQEVIEPLIDLLNKRRVGGHLPCSITTGGIFALRSDFTNVLIEIPTDLPLQREDYPKLMETIVTLMFKGGSVIGSSSVGAKEVDAYRAPLRFRLIKESLFQHGGDAFHAETFLLVDVVDFDRVAAERQVSLLVAYLKDPANLLNLHEDNFEMF